MEIKKVLWPTDFSGSSKQALPYVTMLAERYQTEIHVLYVIDDLAHHEPWYGKFEPSHMDRLVEWEIDSAKERLNQICENHLDGCKFYIKHSAVGDPAKEILKIIKHENINMVVMASKGRKGHFSLGSVAEKVVRNSTVPVVTVPITSEN